jgi:UDP-glucose 4-epimerase
MFADAGYAEKKLGWTAHLGLKDMVTSAWQWELELKASAKEMK